METIAAGEPLPVDVASAVVGEAVLIALEEARLIAVREGAAGAEVAAAHPLYGEVLRADMPVLRLRRLRLALAGAPGRRGLRRRGLRRRGARGRTTWCARRSGGLTAARATTRSGC